MRRILILAIPAVLIVAVILLMGRDRGAKHAGDHSEPSGIAADRPAKTSNAPASKSFLDLPSFRRIPRLPEVGSFRLSEKLEKRSNETSVDYDNRYQVVEIIRGFLEDSELSDDQRAELFSLMADFQRYFNVALDEHSMNRSFYEQFGGFPAFMDEMGAEFERRAESFMPEAEVQELVDAFGDRALLIELIGVAKPIDVP